jgi:hypothetical protein
MNGLVDYLPRLLLQLGDRAYQLARKACVVLKSLETEDDVGRNGVRFAALTLAAPKIELPNSRRSPPPSGSLSGSLNVSPAIARVGNTVGHLTDHRPPIGISHGRRFNRQVNPMGCG